MIRVKEYTEKQEVVTSVVPEKVEISEEIVPKPDVKSKPTKVAKAKVKTDLETTETPVTKVKKVVKKG
jgi:hypothetical protein